MFQYYDVLRAFHIRFEIVLCSYINSVDSKYSISDLKSFGSSCCHYSQKWWQQWDSARRRNSVKNKHVSLKRSPRLSACYPLSRIAGRKEEDDGRRRRSAASYGCCPPGARPTPPLNGDAVVLWPEGQRHNHRSIVHRSHRNRRPRRQLGRRQETL